LEVWAGEDVTKHFGICVPVAEIYVIYTSIFSMNANRNQFDRKTAEKRNLLFNQKKTFEMGFLFSFKTQSVLPLIHCAVSIQWSGYGFFRILRSKFHLSYFCH